MLQHSFTHGLVRITTAALAMACLAGTAQAAGYTLTWLGDLPGGANSSHAHGINDAGQVVGESEAASGTRAYIWDAAGGMRDLGDLPGGQDLSLASGINNAGQVVGSSYVATGSHAFLWDAVGGMQDLGDLPGGIDESLAIGINNAGQVVGAGQVLGGGWQETGGSAFLWDATDGMRDLGDLPGGYDASRAYGINDTGQVVGKIDRNSGHHAFLWDTTNGIQDLGSLPGGVSDLSVAVAINDVGQVVGESSATGGRHPFLWDTENGMRDLGVLPGGALPGGKDLSYANGINDAGQVVGTSRVSADYSVPLHAFLWDVVNGLQDLNDLVDPGLGAVLSSASDINASGQIVGTGLVGGGFQAFLLTPTSDVPVPAALPLMLGGLGVLAGLTRRGSKHVAHAAI
jgi:probable HAF family extracellular repeat protein